MNQHDRRINRALGEYWACERPEAPPAPGIWWDEACAGCVLAYDAAIANGYGYANVVYPGVDFDGDGIPMAEAPIRKWKEMGLV